MDTIIQRLPNDYGSLRCASIVQRHTSETTSRAMLCLADTILWSRGMNNYRSLSSRLDAFEMWIYRRVLNLSWTEKITNDEEVWRRMGIGREIVR